MTLDLKTVSPISGETAMKVRDILRRSYGGFRQDWLTETFRYSPERALELAAALETSGLVTRDCAREEEFESPLPWYKLTDLGWAVARASAARRISRHTAQVALAEFMQRVRFVNDDCRYLYEVRTVVVFGSYLGASKDLGDVDVAVELQPRIAIKKNGKWIDAFREHAWKSGRSFSSFEAEIDWPRREVLFVLKSRKRSISIQSWFAFVEMAATPGFRFEVLHGDRDKIREEVIHSQTGTRMEASGRLGCISASQMS